MRQTASERDREELGLFSKKRKDITVQVYKTNQEANKVYQPKERVPKRKVRRPGPQDLKDERLWVKCPKCGSFLYHEDLQREQKVCPDCGYHFRLTARERIAQIADKGSFREFGRNITSGNPLDFPAYPEKLDKTREQTGLKEAIVTGKCTIEGQPCVLAVMDGFFIMGSMGAAVGEKFALAAERALKDRLPLIAFTVSGGARMQEGLISLMQMGKTAAVLGRLDDARIPYFVVLTDPTTGGVTASFAMLGDVTIAEPDALIGFAGRRVVEQTVKQQLPPGFQRAEFLLEKGFVDMIVPRAELRSVLGRLIRLHQGGKTA
ncbi:MAG: acetyl-CoA carboxylase carboxyltransferase subunit beta [Clostridia bacterium]|nr:acetyl-CoA carboxylase carboxyltransferase subunit beta [Clostridia bacterium]